MKTMTGMVVLIAGGLAVATGAVAQEWGPGRGAGAERFFALHDADGDGKVTAEEIRAARETRFSAIDTNGDGTVNEAEFVAHAAAQADERARARFAQLDADGDGALSRDVLDRRARPVERMVARLDTDGDGALSLEEFETAMERRAGMRGDRGLGLFGKGGGGHGRN